MKNSQNNNKYNNNNNNNNNNYKKKKKKKKLWNMRVTVMPVVIGALGTNPKGLIRELRGVRNRRTSRDHPDYSITRIG